MEEHTPAYKIFHYYFKVLIPASFAFEQQQQLLGTHQYQSAEAEQHATQEMVPRQHTVAEMVDYWKRGAQLILQNPDQAKTIYGWIREHIQRKMNQMSTSLNTGTVPLRDLQDLDEFAKSIYQIARNYEDGVDVRGAAINQKINRVFKRRGGLRRNLAEQQEEQSTPNQERPAPREHDPMADEISRIALERQLPYN